MGLMGFVNLAHGGFAMIGGYVISLLAFFVFAVPVAFALGATSILVTVMERGLDFNPGFMVQKAVSGIDNFMLLSVPFFLLTANLMSIGGITDRLVTLSKALVGHWPGSLAQINVVLSVFFAGISGSSTADAASQSKIFIDAQTKEGYDLSFSIAITAVSAVLAAGDTIVDLQAARNAGAIAVGVLTGALSEAALSQGPHDHIVAGVASIPSLAETRPAPVPVAAAVVS